MNYSPSGTKVDGILYGIDRGSKKQLTGLEVDSNSADVQVREYLKDVAVEASAREIGSGSSSLVAEVRFGSLGVEAREGWLVAGNCA